MFRSAKMIRFRRRSSNGEDHGTAMFFPVRAMITKIYGLSEDPLGVSLRGSFEWILAR